MRPKLLCAAAILFLLPTLAMDAQAATSSSFRQGSYELTLRPDPGHLQSAQGYSHCGGWTHVAGLPDSVDFRSFRFAVRGTFKAILRPELNVFAGETQLVWDMAVRVNKVEKAVARPRVGGGYVISYPVSAFTRFELWSCNVSGFPNATVSWSFTPR